MRTPTKIPRFHSGVSASSESTTPLFPWFRLFRKGIYIARICVPNAGTSNNFHMLNHYLVRRKISSLFCSDKFFLRSSLSRTFESWIPKTILSRKIWSTVIVSNSHRSANCRRVVSDNGYTMLPLLAFSSKTFIFQKKHSWAAGNKQQNSLTAAHSVTVIIANRKRRENCSSLGSDHRKRRRNLYDLGFLMQFHSYRTSFPCLLKFIPIFCRVWIMDIKRCWWW